MNVRSCTFGALVIWGLLFATQVNGKPTESNSLLIMSMPASENNTFSEQDSDKPSKPQIVSAYFDEVWNDSYQDLDYNESVFHFSFSCGDLDVSKCQICVYSGPLTWETIDKLGGAVIYDADFESYKDNVWTYKMTGITWGEFFQIGIYSNSIWGGWSDLRLSTDYLSEDFIKKINENFDNILSIDEIGNDEIKFIHDTQTISFTGNISNVSSISLLDIWGRTVYQQYNADQINTSALPHGIYILHITPGSGNPIVHKLIL